MSSILWLCLWMTCFISTSASSTLKDNTQTDLKSPTVTSCAVVINEGDITEVRRLLTIEHVNMIDLQLFTGPDFGERLFPHLQITFASAKGRQILSLLDIKYLIITWTLAAGRRRFGLRIRESRVGCMQTMENKTDFVSGNLLKQLIGSTQRTYCEVCYAEPKVSQLHGSARRCCNITENDYSKYHCYEDQYQNQLLSLLFLNIPTYIIGMAFILLTFRLCVLTKTSHEMDNRYYYLTENTTSISCFFRFIISNDHGRTISIVRRLLFVFVICFLYTTHLKGTSTYLDYSIVYYWAIFFPFSNMFNKVTLCKDDQRHHKWHKEKVFLCLSNIMALHLKYDLGDLSSSNCAEIDALQLICSLPFNIKRWKVAIEKMHKVISRKLSVLKWETKNSFYNSFQENLFCMVVIVFFLVYIPVIVAMMILLIITTTCFYLYKVVVYSVSLTQAPRSRSDLLFYIHEVLILIHTVIVTGLILQFTWIPFYAGLLANILYFVPHITAVSVSTFYFLQFWKSMDSKYFALKMFIYEECKDRKWQNNDDSDKNSQTESGDIVPVVSKQLYCKIREKLLPYHTILWIHGFEMFGCGFFLFIFICVIMEQQEYNATPVVKVLTTMSISVLPYIFNSVTLGLSEEEKRARDEGLKLKIRRVVDKLIAEDSELSKTDFTLQLHKNETIVQRPGTEESSEHDELVSTEPKDNTQWETSM